MGEPSYCVRGGRLRKSPVQGFRGSLLGPTERGTQDSNLESPVLETDAHGLHETGVFAAQVGELSTAASDARARAGGLAVLPASRGEQRGLSRSTGA